MPRSGDRKRGYCSIGAKFGARVISNAHFARMADALCQLELSQDRSRYLILRFDEILLLWLFGFRYRNPPCSDLAVSAPQVANVREVPISVANTFWLCEQY